MTDEEYVNVITESIPIWLAQGHKELSDYRCIWDWLKYNVRAYAIQYMYSKKKARERKEKEKSSGTVNQCKMRFRNKSK